MSSKQIIKDLVSTMKTTSENYDNNAKCIWDMLSQEEQWMLAGIIDTPKPVFDGPVIKDPTRAQLVDYGLATRNTYQGNEGYTVATFPGLAAYKAGRPKPDNLTLPGESKK